MEVTKLKMENPVEKVLKDKGLQGLSLRKLGVLLGVDARRVKYHIYNSKNVMDTNPLLHGSGKRKIRVYSYTTETNGYFNRKKLNKKVQDPVAETGSGTESISE